MNSRNELLGSKIELSRQHKKRKIMADALTAHIMFMLSETEFEKMDTEDLLLSAQGLSELVIELQSLSERLGKINEALGM